ncbi:hypothetical protein A3Q29_16330 [Providencia stuartii]|uniref:Uncharacterized protein n=1 Tax=Providencia stuartii TaxID=588 RepID=A0A1S1HRT3_PROST|nr:hypothetical protein A3Q29_16330 [Providencia stuartii]
MAMKLEVIVTFDQSSQKCSIAWSADHTQDVVAEERNILECMKKAILIQLEAPASTSILH